MDLFTSLLFFAWIACFNSAISKRYYVLQDNMVRTLESNIKTAMTAAINEYCSCGFHEKLIDMGEMSCHSSCSSNCKTAVYRHAVL